jgi:hypothetical protein
MAHEVVELERHLGSGTPGGQTGYDRPALIYRVWIIWPSPFQFITVRISTCALMTLIAVVIGGWRRRPLLALTTIGAWIFLFEIPYHWTNVVIWRWDWRSALLWTIGFGGWVVAGWYAGLRPSLGFVGVFCALWIVWVATGFHYNNVGDKHMDWAAEALNEGTKTSLGLAYLFAALKVRTPAGLRWPGLPGVKQSPAAEKPPSNFAK